MISGDGDQRPGLYVHVPFCVSRCSYCAFQSGTDLSLTDLFFEGVEREVALRARIWGGFDTVYLGGGTPSVLGPAGLERLARCLEPLELLPEASWTVELNPDDCSADLFRALRSLGVRRVSLGVQSLDDRALRFLGRRHDAASARRAAELAHSAGFEDVSLDLIFALPGQPLQHWLGQIGRALELEPTHLSCYELTVEDGTRLQRAVSAERVRMPDDERRRDLFLEGSRALRDRGWDHYEVSNFARSPALRARHNEKYWAHVPYLGLGPGAHGFDGLWRWWNHGDVQDWAGALERGELPSQADEMLDDQALRLERLSLGFRHHGGVPLSDLAGKERSLRLCIEDGLLVRHGDRVHPTPLGYLVADGLALRFA